MKILYGITKSSWGGAQKYVYDLATEAKKAGHDVAVLTGGNGLMAEKLERAGVRIISLPYMGRDVRLAAEIKSFFDIYKILKTEKPDVFHINSSKMGGTGAFVARLARIKKIIFTAHGWAFNEPRHWAETLIIEELAWLTVLLSHKTICVSEAIRRDMAEKPFIRHKLVVIRHGLEPFPLLERDRARQILASGAKPDTLLVGTISELHKVKGLDVALKAFALATKGTPKESDTLFSIIGAGDERENLENLARELHIDFRAKFLGFKDNARELLSGLDIFVLSSRSEALGYVLLEAGYAELPVIATAVGGIPEIIKNDETGLLVKSGDYKTLARAITKLAADSNQRKILGQNLKLYIENNFSKERMLEKTFELYQ